MLAIFADDFIVIRNAYCSCTYEVTLTIGVRFVIVKKILFYLGCLPHFDLS